MVVSHHVVAGIELMTWKSEWPVLLTSKPFLQLHVKFQTSFQLVAMTFPLTLPIQCTEGGSAKEKANTLVQLTNESQSEEEVPHTIHSSTWVAETVGTL